MEIGPYRLKDKATLQYNEGGWDEFANLLFVDNPVGTGFSRVDGDAYVHDLETMAEHMVKFLEKWFGMFPHFEHDDVCLSSFPDRDAANEMISSTFRANPTQANTSPTSPEPFSSATKRPPQTNNGI